MSKEPTQTLAEATATLSLSAQKGPNEIFSTRVTFSCTTITQCNIFLLHIYSLELIWVLVQTK